MIAVVADDFTGAAEIAAVGWRCGRKSAVTSKFQAAERGSVISLDTDSRDQPPSAASRLIRDAGRRLRSVEPEQTFKKVDSVLRGPVAAEAVALAEALEKPVVLLVPANPGLGRTIEGGRYRIQGVPIHETDFARDPRHPRLTSDVQGLLAGDAGGGPDVQVLPAGAPLPARGFFVGEAVRPEHLRHWAGQVRPDVLAAGASEFFEALLRGPWEPSGTAGPGGGPGWAGLGSSERVLLLSGSSSDYSRHLSDSCSGVGIPVCRIPNGWREGRRQTAEAWGEAVAEAFQRSSLVRAALDLPPDPDPRTPSILVGQLAAMTQFLIQRIELGCLCVEGGATASRLVRDLGWTPLPVVAELAAGVVAMRTGSASPRLLITKPGSYRWPDRLFEEIGRGSMGLTV